MTLHWQIPPIALTEGVTDPHPASPNESSTR